MGAIVPQVITEDRAGGAQIVDGGLRFVTGKSQYLSRTPSSAGNRTTWTWSGWTKLNDIPSGQYAFFNAKTGSGNANTGIDYDSAGPFRFVIWNGSGTDALLTTTQVFRDFSAWYHLVVAVDTTQATTSNRVKMYINGSQITSFSSATYPTQYYTAAINLAQEHNIGRNTGTGSAIFNGQLSNVYFIDGQALDPSYFGYTDPLSNTWRPKKYVNTTALPGDGAGRVGFGTNGFYLPFDGNSPIGQDRSGPTGIGWTAVNFGGSNTIEKATGALPILNTDGGGKVARVGVRTDANASSLVLALPLVGIKSDFSNAVNSGTSNKAITATNATATSSFSNFYGGSFDFSGTASAKSLSFSPGNDLAFGTGDFTIEAWVYMISRTTSWNQYVLDTIGGTRLSFFQGISQGYEKISFSVGSDNVTSPLEVIKYGQWQHWAATRQGTTLRVFVDGVLQGTGTSSTNVTAQTTAVIGQTPNASNANYNANGYIQDFRIYKGLAKYTSNFIPASTDPDIVPDSPSGVSYSSNVALVPSTNGAVAFDGTTDYLTVPKTNAWPTGTQDASIEFFLYRNGSGSSVTLFGKDYSGAGLSCFYLTSANVLYFYDNNIATTGGNGIGGVTIAQGKWYHVALTRSGSSLRLFLDGQLIDSNLSASGNWYDSGSISYVMIGAREAPLGNQSLNGFISNAHVVFDTALYTSNFTPPSAPISSVANTKLLCCKSNSSATAADVTPGSITANGNAAASNFNPFTVNINTQRGKQSGYCTLNPLKKGAHITSVTNGNLQFESTGSSQYGQIWGTVAVNSGKWYWEGTELSGGGIAYGWGLESANSLTSEPGGDANTWVYLSSGYKYNSGSIVSYGFSSDDGDTIGVAFNADNGELSFYKNGIYMGVAYTLTTGRYYAPVTGDPNSSTNCSGAVNFGQKPFKFPPPAGFQPLTLANTPRPTIVRPDQYVGVSTFTGNSGTQNITCGFKPDLVWVKGRNAADNHSIFDSVRGATRYLSSSTTGTEGTNASSLVSFNNDGFTSGGSVIGGNGTTYVAWAWKAGGNSNTFNIDDVGYATASAAGLTAGTKTPTGASVNTKSGFSIIAFTGDQNAGTISHGLGRAPSFYIVKTRDSNSGGSNDWYCYHSALGASARIQLNSTDGQTTGSSQWNSTSPTSSVLSLGSGAWQETGDRFIIYAWAEIPGFSKFGSYTSANNADNVFVHTGFRPRVILIKKYNTSGRSWVFIDTERDKFNIAKYNLWPNLTDGDTTTYDVLDVLSNGFKVRTNTNGWVAESTDQYIYCAWAETPSFNLYGAQSNAR